VIVSEFLENIYKNKPENVIFTNIFDHCMVVYTVFRKYITEDTVSITVDSKKQLKTLHVYLLAEHKRFPMNIWLLFTITK